MVVKTAASVITGFTTATSFYVINPEVDFTHLKWWLCLIVVFIAFEFESYVRKGR